MLLCTNHVIGCYWDSTFCWCALHANAWWLGAAAVRPPLRLSHSNHHLCSPETEPSCSNRDSYSLLKSDTTITFISVALHPPVWTVHPGSQVLLVICHSVLHIIIMCTELGVTLHEEVPQEVYVEYWSSNEEACQVYTYAPTAYSARRLGTVIRSIQ